MVELKKRWESNQEMNAYNKWKSNTSHSMSSTSKEVKKMLNYRSTNNNDIMFLKEQTKLFNEKGERKKGKRKENQSGK